MRQPSIELRAATAADVPAIRRLHAESLRRLGRGHYDAPTLERVIEGGTFEPELLRGGRYKTAHVGDRLVGCAGWLEGGPAAPQASQPAHLRMARPTGTAVIRAVYVDPDYARHGIGRTLMAVIEAEAGAAGNGVASLLSTAMAVRFYSRLGYAVERPLALALEDGQLVEVFAMTKALPAPVTIEAAPSRLAGRVGTEPPPYLARAA